MTTLFEKTQAVINLAAEKTTLNLSNSSVMNRLNEISECGFVTSIPDWKLAALLGLSLQEYHDLNHRGLKELTDMFGKVTEYYIHVSQHNKTEILDKLDRDRYGYIRFRPEQLRHFFELENVQSFSRN